MWFLHCNQCSAHLHCLCPRVKEKGKNLVLNQVHCAEDCLLLPQMCLALFFFKNTNIHQRLLALIGLLWNNTD